MTNWNKISAEASLETTIEEIAEVIASGRPVDEKWLRERLNFRNANLTSERNPNVHEIDFREQGSPCATRDNKRNLVYMGKIRSVVGADEFYSGYC